MAFIILLICFIFLVLLLLLCGDVEINPGPTSSAMLQINKRIDSLKAPSCVKERTPLTLVPIHDVHEVSTLPNIIDVEIVQKNLLDGQFVAQMANGNRYSKAQIDKVMSMKEVILEKREVREELLWFDKMKKGFNCPKSVSVKDSLINYANIIVDNLH